MTRLTVAALLLPWASSVTLAQASLSAVRAGITPAKIDVTLHEPVTAALTVQNGLSKPVVLDLGDDRKNDIVVKTIFPDGSARSNRLPNHEGLARLGQVTLAPGESYSQVLVFNDWLTFPVTGLYNLQIDILNSVAVPDGAPIRLGPLFASVIVSGRDAQRLDQLCAASLDRLSRARSYSAARQEAEFLTRVEDPVAVPFLRRAMARTSYPIQPLIVQGLERVATPEAVKALLEAFETEPATVPEARAALSRLMDKISDADLKTEIQNALDARQ